MLIGSVAYVSGIQNGLPSCSTAVPTYLPTCAKQREHNIKALLLGKAQLQEHARPVQHHSCIKEGNGYDRGIMPRLRAEEFMRSNAESHVCSEKVWLPWRNQCLGLLQSAMIFVGEVPLRERSMGGLVWPEHSSWDTGQTP